MYAGEGILGRGWPEGLGYYGNGVGHSVEEVKAELTYRQSKGQKSCVVWIGLLCCPTKL